MPRVSEEHLERRRQQILDAALECFARKGFHATSMQDVFTEAGLSAGAVYRYFKSKDELIAALAADATVLLRGAMEEVVQRDPLPTPGEVIAALTTEIIRIGETSGRVRLAPQAWALAVTDPTAHTFVSTAIRTLRDRWRDYAERMRAAGWLPPDADTDAVAKALLGIMPGFVLQHLLLGDIDPQTLARGMDLLLPDYRHASA
ncbi:TetR/AcrR family transcriptional regulator [Nocardia sp. CDC159]|uniref:TetR/AcrR family transcriptional regulator n=1 Tax=Nocardia pulmonis TaxID=2951408 RepID=A0A9X2IVW1_9NOCA|nr:MULTISPECIES: TetR/AcrR family transcriptional regulator [Nocardia]MCM6773633.1 TetR/AcrR family transcriptional regulator [Nocardia pulmonis]MCM6786520.1 TetR/AcrR family transcriptional regulator [Nocardia sp. CDC159]